MKCSLISFRRNALLSKGVISPYEIAIYGTHHGCQHLRWCCPQPQRLDKELHTDVVQENGAHDRQSIAHNLRQCAHLRCPKCNIAIEPEASQKSYWKDHRKRCNMRRHNHKRQVYILLTYNVMVDNIVPHRIEYGIGCATGQIAEHLLRKEFSQRRNIEHIYKSCNYGSK